MTTPPAMCPECENEMTVVYGVEGNLYAGCPECLWMSDPLHPIPEGDLESALWTIAPSEEAPRSEDRGASPGGGGGC